MTTTIKTNHHYDLEKWKQGYRSLYQEYDYTIDNIEGKIPAELNGTLFRNGPGLLDNNGVSVRHPFDGDGMICKVKIADGQAHFQNKYVRTAGYVAEQQAKKFVYRGVFGTQKPGGILANAFDLRLKNIANTNVIYWGDKLLALWEAAEPHRLDPKNLDTIGIDYLNNVLKPGDAFSAHPRIDPTGKLVNFGIKAGFPSVVKIYEFDPTGQLIKQYSHKLPGFAFIHDFVITPNYCIFFLNPVAFNPLPFVFGLKGAGESIKFEQQKPTKIIIVPRDGSDQIQVLETQSGFVFHHVNAFEMGDNLTIDSICYATLPTVEPNRDFREINFDRLDPGQLWRFNVNLKTKTVDRQLLLAQCCEFPTIHPQKVGQHYRYTYMGVAQMTSGNHPLQQIVKLDVTTQEKLFWTAFPDGFVTEPIFIPRSQIEDDGWLIAMVYDGQLDRSSIVILNAQDLSVVAKLNLKHHIPYGLHGSWVEYNR